jgi:hypothetical protein
MHPNKGLTTFGALSGRIYFVFADQAFGGSIASIQSCLTSYFRRFFKVIMRDGLVQAPSAKRWIVAGLMVVAAVALSVVTFVSVGERDATRAVAMRHQREPTSSRLIDERTLKLTSSGDELSIGESRYATPLVSGDSSDPQTPIENETAANLFGARSLAIVPEEWPRARMKFVIGATAMVHEAQSDLEFQARVDTGAHTCSLHVEEFVIRDESPAMEENIGKEIRLKVTNHEGMSQWIKSIVDCCTKVRTSDNVEQRYKVPVAFRWNDLERMVLVTLNNRAKMTYPLLLGRNFLEKDFVVDVALDSGFAAAAGQ